MNGKFVSFAMIAFVAVMTTGCASLEMVHPNGGELWKKGRTYTIRWNSENLTGDVVVKLKGGTGPGGWFTACERVPVEAGQCDYTLPCNFGWRQAVAHVMTPSASVSDQSDASLNIEWPDVAELDRQLRALYGNSTYFQDNPRIAQATVESFDRHTLYAFCSHLAHLENAGETHVEKPLALQQCSEPDPCFQIVPTDAELANILAAKAAHTVWLDKEQLVPWRLSEFNDADLAGLFSRPLLLDEPVPGYPYFFSVVDYSPSEAYRYARDNQLIQDSLVDTLLAVVNDVRGKHQLPTFLHGSEHYGDPYTAYTLYDALTSVSDRGHGQYRIARYGCHSMARIMVGLLRSLNIPGETPTDGEWTGAPHSSAVWPVLQHVLPNGDDIYNGSLTEIPTEEFLPTFDIYDHPTYTSICGSDKPCISHRHRAILAMNYPASWVRTRCCNPENYGYSSCLDYLSNEYGAYLTEQEITDAVERIEELCQ